MTDPNLDTIVDVVISSSTQTPSRPGFGVALILASQVPGSWGPNRVRSFGSPDEIVAAGFTATNEARALAETYFAQNPRPNQVKIGRRANVPTKKVVATVTSAAEGNIYTLTLGALEVSYTAPAAPTPTSVATALAALVTAPTGWGVAAAAGVLTFTALAAGSSPVLAVVRGPVTLAETTLDPGIVADLDAVNAEDKDWYGLLIDIEGKPTITAAAPWAQANMKLYGYETSDTECVNPAVTTDILSNMTTLGVAHAFGCYSHLRTNARIPAGMMGRLFPYDPGTENWAFKELLNVPVSTIDSAVFNAIDAKRGNVYCYVQGAKMTWQGRTHTSWIDAIRAIDFATAKIRIDFFEVFLNNVRVPYTDFGGDMMQNALEGSLSQMENDGLLDAGRGHTTEVPKIATLTSAQRNSRVFGGIKFSAWYSGAMNKAKINGSILP